MTILELFETLGGPAAVSRIINVGPSTASEMKRRGSIPVDYWPALIAEAAARGIPGITAEALLAIHAAPVQTETAAATS